MSQDPTAWRVSSYSASEGNCVEIGATGTTVAVRDTKDRADVVLRVSAQAWHRFTATLR